MTACLINRNSKTASLLVAVSLALTVGTAVAGDRLSPRDIVNALRPQAPTRSLTLSPADQAEQAKEKRFIDSLRNRTTRSLSLGERQQIATMAETKPRIDLDINFDFNSAKIGHSATAEINNLGKALTDASLRGSTFVLAGHTDAVGSDEYNMELSGHRADAVKNYLVEKFKISPDKLLTAAYGKTHLKNKKNPRAAENRRVEVVNVAGR